jgi:UPF0755 protein
MNRKKFILFLILIIIILGGFVAYRFYNKIYKSNVAKEGFIYLKSNATLAELESELSPFLKDKNAFLWVASTKKFTKVKSGKYQIKKGMSNNDLVNLLRSGHQTPITLSFNNQETLQSLAKRISEQIEADSSSLYKAFTDTNFLTKTNFTEAQALGIFIPNSYEFYWNTSAEKFRDKMYAEYQRFWTDARIEKAQKINLSKKDVMTLASIVHKETDRTSERSVVAGLYLNRLRDKWPLQADPTIIYAMKQKYGQDFEMRRVLYKNIEDIKDSPYNTYKVNGLPPSLIAMPDISAIDAVLNAKQHDYYFMCASVSKIGYHEFAKTLAQHNLNRKKFINKKNKQGIKQ